MNWPLRDTVFTGRSFGDGQGAVPIVNFSIAKRLKGKSLISNCSLRLREKLFKIRNLDNVSMLNKKSEFISKCSHINN